MPVRFVCTCGMAFTVEEVRPGRPVACPTCGALQGAAAADGAPRGDERAPGAGPGPAAGPPPEAVVPDRVGEPVTVRCQQCGALNAQDDPVCGLCGARLGSEVLFLGSAGDRALGPPRRPASRVTADEAVDLEERFDLEAEAADEGPRRRREPLRYEGEHYVPMGRLILRMLLHPRSEMETLVSFLSYPDMVWKLLVFFLAGVVGLWLSGRAYPSLPIVSGFTFGSGVPATARWYVWLGMAFSAAAFITAGLTFLAAVAGMLTGHGWHLSPLALAFLFIVSLVNTAHLLLLAIGLVNETLAMVAAWGLLVWEVMLTVCVISKVLDCDPILSVLIAVAICGTTVHFYNRVYRLAEGVMGGVRRPAVSAVVQPGERRVAS